MAYDEALADRVGRQFPGVAGKRMFGTLAFLTDGNLTVCVNGPDLMVRVGPDALGEALDEPGVRQCDMRGRPMAGWVLVGGDRLDGDGLTRWIGRARTFVATLPPK